MDAVPLDVATAETVEFIAGNVPSDARILEIGCGTGEVAAALLRLGHCVVGIDAGADEVQAARTKGVHAILGRWPDVEAPVGDAVTFTRSLHHIGHLDAALTAARTALAGSGLLLVDDFDFPAVDGTTIRWLIEKTIEAEAEGLAQPGDSFAARIAAAADPVAAWQHEHDHDLHSASAIADAVGAHFTITRQESVPYLYRYLIPLLRPSATAASWLLTTLERERSLGEGGALRLIGRRIVAHARGGLDRAPSTRSSKR